MKTSTMVWTVDDACSLVQRMGVFAAGVELVGEEIGDGNLNYVFRLRDPQTNRSVIVKKAVPYLRVVGEGWPLTLERATLEAKALKFQSTVAPEHVPTLYGYSTEDHAIIMEDLGHLTVMREALNQGRQFPYFAEHIAHFLAQTLFWSSDRAGEIDSKKYRASEMTNPELCRITEALILTDPFYNAPTNRIDVHLEQEVEALWQDSDVLDNVFFLKDRFMTVGQALVHADLHTGSIMIGPEESRVIDPEFAFYGPMGFDVGLLLANLFLNMIGHGAQGTSYSYLTYLRHTTDTIWRRFVEEFLVLWHSSGSYDQVFRTPALEQKYLLEVLRDTVGYAGCEMIRRTIGLAQVTDLNRISNENARRIAQETSLGLGRELIRKHRDIQDIDVVLTTVDRWILGMKITA